MSFWDIALRVVVVLLAIAVLIGALWLLWRLLVNVFSLIPNIVNERAYKKSKETQPGEVESTESGWLDITTEGSDTFSYMVRQKGKGWAFYAFYVKFTPEFMYLSQPHKTSMWLHKRMAKAEEVMASASWMDKARKYDMAEISSNSFRIVQRPFGQEMGYIIVMDYGDRQVTLNLHDGLTSWYPDTAEDLIARFRKAYMHVNRDTQNPDDFDQMAIADIPPLPTAKERHDEDPF